MAWSNNSLKCQPFKHAIKCQNRIGIGQMLLASGRYRPSSGSWWRVYREIKLVAYCGFRFNERTCALMRNDLHVLMNTHLKNICCGVHCIFAPGQTADILPMTFSNAVSWMKIIAFFIQIVLKKIGCFGHEFSVGFVVGLYELATSH